MRRYVYLLMILQLVVFAACSDSNTNAPLEEAPEEKPPEESPPDTLVIPIYNEPCEPIPLQGAPEGKILFSSRRSGDFRQLYTMNPDGSDIQQLTFGAFQSMEGHWSKNGAQIVFRSDSIETTLGQGLYIMDADGKNIHALKENFYFGKFPLVGWQPDWSPDGQKLVFISCFQCEPYPVHHLFTINSDGTGLQQMTNTDEIPIGGVSPSWSPDGSQIALNGGGEIYIFDADGKNLRRLNLNRPTGASLSWSPDGCKIVLESTAKSNRWGELFIFDLETGIISQVTFHTSDEVFLYPRWSPDGEKLVFESQLTDGSGRSFIYTVNRDGTNLRRLLDDSTANFPDWSWN